MSMRLYFAHLQRKWKADIVVSESIKNLNFKTRIWLFLYFWSNFLLVWKYYCRYYNIEAMIYSSYAVSCQIIISTVKQIWLADNWTKMKGNLIALTFIDVTESKICSNKICFDSIRSLVKIFSLIFFILDLFLPLRLFYVALISELLATSDWLYFVGEVRFSFKNSIIFEIPL